jgi:hypothetical protein
LIREERDPAWWQRIADHPAVAPTIYLTGERVSFGPALARPEVVPLAATHGGLWFVWDGKVCELHAMFLPAGQGHEANAALKLGYEEMIQRGAEGFRVSEVEGVKTSRPPKSHGWRLEGEFAPGPLNLSLRHWGLSVAAWRASPAYRRMA